MRYQAEIARSGAGTVEAGSGDVVVEGPGAVVVAGSADGSVVAGTVVDRPVVAVGETSGPPTPQAATSMATTTGMKMGRFTVSPSDPVLGRESDATTSRRLLNGVTIV